jgi:hypothetical protein
MKLIEKLERNSDAGNDAARNFGGRLPPGASVDGQLELPRFRRQIVVLVGDDFWASSSSMVQRNVV